MADLIPMDQLSGSLNGMATLEGTLTKDFQYQTYAGDYIVDPIVEADQILKTKDMLMADDVTMKKIPMLRATNPNGGITVIIGEKEEENNGSE